MSKKLSKIDRLTNELYQAILEKAIKEAEKSAKDDKLNARACDIIPVIIHHNGSGGY